MGVIYPFYLSCLFILSNSYSNNQGVDYFRVDKF